MSVNIVSLKRNELHKTSKILWICSTSIPSAKVQHCPWSNNLIEDKKKDKNVEDYKVLCSILATDNPYKVTFMSYFTPSYAATFTSCSFKKVENYYVSRVASVLQWKIDVCDSSIWVGALPWFETEFLWGPLYIEMLLLISYSHI